MLLQVEIGEGCTCLAHTAHTYTYDLLPCPYNMRMENIRCAPLLGICQLEYARLLLRTPPMHIPCSPLHYASLNSSTQAPECPACHASAATALLSGHTKLVAMMSLEQTEGPRRPVRPHTSPMSMLMILRHTPGGRMRLTMIACLRAYFKLLHAQQHPNQVIRKQAQ